MHCSIGGAVFVVKVAIYFITHFCYICVPNFHHYIKLYNIVNIINRSSLYFAVHVASGQNPPGNAHSVTINIVAIAGVAIAGVASPPLPCDWGLSTGERVESGCRWRRQTGEPSELRFETQIVNRHAWETRGTVRLMVKVRVDFARGDSVSESYMCFEICLKYIMWV